MNFKSNIFTLMKEVDKLLILNIMAILIISNGILLFNGYSREEILLTFIPVTFISTLSGLITTRFFRKRINLLFEKIEFSLYFDELTSVYNRAAGMNRLREEMARAKRNGNPLTVAMVDIDNFKLINDFYGHLTGDRVLADVVVNIKNQLRINDIVVRYGGDEFLIILPDTDEIGAYKVLERVVDNVSRQPLVIGKDKIWITLSIGIAEIDFLDDLNSAIEKADMAMYRAKRNGKNRIESLIKFIPNLRLS